MKLRIYTQYGTNERRIQYAYCSVYDVGDNPDDEAWRFDTGRFYSNRHQGPEDAAKDARREVMRALQELIFSNLTTTMTIEFHETQDDRG